MCELTLIALRTGKLSNEENPLTDLLTDVLLPEPNRTTFQPFGAFFTRLKRNNITVSHLSHPRPSHFTI